MPITDPIIHAVKLSFTRCYLIKIRGGYLLIDTSYSNQLSRFKKSIARLGIELADIQYLLLTHHHDDHAGFAAELAELTGCQVIAHEHAAAPLHRGASEESMQPFNRRVQLVFSLFSLFHRHFSFPPVRLDNNKTHLVRDDSDLLQQLGIDGKIVHTPGHSQDSISVVLSNGSAFVGDVAMNFMRFTGVGHHPIYVEDKVQVASSWQRLIDEGAQIVYPSHGHPFPAEALTRALRHSGT